MYFKKLKVHLLFIRKLENGNKDFLILDCILTG